MKLFDKVKYQFTQTTIAFDAYINKGLDTTIYPLHRIHIIILLHLYERK